MDASRSRLTQVFKFLKELNELRNPVPREMSAYPEVLRLDSWPVHPVSYTHLTLPTIYSV